MRSSSSLSLVSAAAIAATASSCNASASKAATVSARFSVLMGFLRSRRRRDGRAPTRDLWERRRLPRGRPGLEPGLHKRVCARGHPAPGYSTAMDQSAYDAIARLYDPWSRSVVEDISFYVEEAIASRGPVVELGVGTGRIAIPVAAAGVEVIG